MHTYAYIGGLLRAVTQTQRGNHVAFGSYAHAGAPSHAAFAFNLLPKVIFCTLHLIILRIVFYLLHDEVYLFEFQIHNIVHNSLGDSHVFGKLVEVEIGLFGKRINHIAKQVYAKQATTVVRTERNFATRISADRAKTQVGIAVGDAFAQYGVPEKHARFCTLPCVMYDFFPQRLGRNFFLHLRVVAFDGELLHIRLIVYGCLHKVVVYFHRHVRARNLTFGHFRVDKGLAVGMLNANRQHQRTTPSVLCHLARRIAVTFHKRHKPRRRKRGIINGRTLGTYVRKVVPHSTAAFHQLHLFFVDAHDSPIRVGIAFKPHNKAVA